MSNRFYLIIFIISLIFFILISAAISGSSSLREHEIKEKIFFDDRVDLRQPRYMFPTQKYGLWIVFLNDKNNIIAKNISKKLEFTLNQEKAGLISEGVVCEMDGKLNFAWRAKAQSKTIEFKEVDITTGIFGKKIIVDQYTEPLARIKIGCQNSIINLVWYGEKADSKGRKYSIYASRSHDSGKTFSLPVELTPETRASIYPTLVTDEDGNAYVFTEVIKKENHEMVFIKSTEKGWDKPQSIGNTGKVSIYIRPLKIKDIFLVSWFNYYDGIPVTEVAYSDNNGNSWNKYTLEATRNIDITGMQVVAGDNQHIYIVLSGINLNQKNDDPQKAKDQLFFFYSRDGGKTFSGPVSIRHDKFGSYTRAHLPNIVAKGKKVVVVWNDYRNIRANLYMNYSTDGGITWQPEDIPLEEPGKYNTVLHWDVNNLVEYEGAYHVLAHRFKDDAMEEAYPVVISFKVEK